MANANGLIVEAQADFAVKLLREVSKQGQQTTIVSPISVAIALSMVYAGAKEETAKQMNQLLANGAPDSAVHQFFGELVESIKSAQKNYTLEMANKVYTKDGFSVLDTFKSTIQHHYGGLFEAVNFMQADETAKKMNNFVENVTHNKIHDLIQASMLDQMTRLVLINAIYFKGNWADKFNPQRTEKKPFYMAEGQEKQVDMMQKKAKFIYQDTEEFQVLGMPYVGEEVFMFIILPRERFGLSRVLANLTGSKLVELVQNRHKVEVEVVLPKFKLESTHDLNEPLKKLGISNAFGGDADFSRITEDEPLAIDQVIQKAFIEVNEEGTEAAAATAIRMVRCCALIEPRPTPEFIADHPFGYALKAQQTTTLLFNGTFAG